MKNKCLDFLVYVRDVYAESRVSIFYWWAIGLLILVLLNKSIMLMLAYLGFILITLLLYALIAKVANWYEEGFFE